MRDTVISYVDDNGELREIMESDLQRLDELYEPDEFDLEIERITREKAEQVAKMIASIDAERAAGRTKPMDTLFSEEK
jgi:hypothetical protein